MQTTSRLLMIRPSEFAFNVQTAASNVFQKAPLANEQVHEQVLREFDRFVALLRDNKVLILVVDDDPEQDTPDAIFPNNWISTHEDGTLIIYPVEAENRRAERRMDIVKAIQNGYRFKHFVDLSFFELSGKFLEGTGSMVIDRDFSIAYASISTRTHPDVLNYAANLLNYDTVTFHATDHAGRPIYHTNVMTCIGRGFALVCLEAIHDEKERSTFLSSLIETNKEIIPVSLDQMNHFAANILQIENTEGESLIVMSSGAYSALTETQHSALTRYGKIIYSPLTTIERIGGGSARCMIAEIHPPKTTLL
ncbi:citrulline utilization hydrolase CtlX [Arcticibacter sp.]|uniref:citrulline utilization hydrolase CtlX n=1 Tax=Arcticibacter sp. TaxID=1872630 RepID=UPI00388E8940